MPPCDVAAARRHATPCPEEVVLALTHREWGPQIFQALKLGLHSHGSITSFFLLFLKF